MSYRPRNQPQQTPAEKLRGPGPKRVRVGVSYELWQALDKEAQRPECMFKPCLHRRYRQFAATVRTLLAEAIEDRTGALGILHLPVDDKVLSDLTVLRNYPEKPVETIMRILRAAGDIARAEEERQREEHRTAWKRKSDVPA